MKTYTSLADVPLNMSVEDVAAVLGMSRMYAYSLCKQPDFPALRMGKRIIIPKDRFIRWMEERAKDGEVCRE